MKSRREAEFNQRKAEREERINQIIQARKQEREALRKKIFFVRSEEERLNKLREEEEARKLEGLIPSTLNGQLFSYQHDPYFMFNGFPFLHV